MKTRELTTLALASALLAAIEILLGNLLRLLNCPFIGNLLVGINLMVYLVIKKQVPWRGSVVLVGLICAIIRLGAPCPGLAFFPALAIFLEAVLIESCFWLVGTGLGGALVSGIISAYFVLLYRLLTFLFLLYLGGMANQLPFFTEWVNKWGFQQAVLLVIFLPLFNGLFWGITAFKLAPFILKALERKNLKA